eukprot:9628611-Lingulodinium_polyedra.AAC.1
MREHGAEALATHALQAWGSRTADQLLQAAASGQDCGAPAAWGPDDWREAVVLPVPRGAIPVVYAALARTLGHLGGKLGVQAGALLVQHLSPEH